MWSCFYATKTAKAKIRQKQFIAIIVATVTVIVHVSYICVQLTDSINTLLTCICVHDGICKLLN